MDMSKRNFILLNGINGNEILISPDDIVFAIKKEKEIGGTCSSITVQPNPNGSPHTFNVKESIEEVYKKIMIANAR